MQCAIGKLTHKLGRAPDPKVIASLAPAPLAQDQRLGPTDESCVEEVLGDLFQCPETSSLGHCVSADLAMGKGIAVLFKNLFQGVEELKAQACSVGDTGVLERNGRFVYYLVSKDKFWNKPTPDDVRRSLLSMRQHALDHEVTHICLPRIACGLDGLLWVHVRGMLVEVFSGSGVQVTVYSLE